MEEQTTYELDTTVGMDTEVVAPRATGTPQEQWDAALAANPWLLGEVVRTLRQLWDAGKRPSMNRCWEEMRERVHTTGSEYRMDNTWRAPAARHVIRTHPEFAGVIEARRSRA